MADVSWLGRREPADVWRHRWAGGRGSAARPVGEGPRRSPRPVRVHERGRASTATPTSTRCIEGTVAKPLLDGRIILDGAEIAIAEPRVVLSELNGPIVLDGQLAVFDGVRGLANGGALALDGSLAVRSAWRSAAARSNIQAQGVALETAEGPAQRARCAGHLPARSAQPVADRRHPRRAERLHRDDHDRGAGAAGGAAGHGGVRRRSVRISIGCSSISR